MVRLGIVSLYHFPVHSFNAIQCEGGKNILNMYLLCHSFSVDGKLIFTTETPCLTNCCYFIKTEDYYTFSCIIYFYLVW